MEILFWHFWFEISPEQGDTVVVFKLNVGGLAKIGLNLIRNFEKSIGWRNIICVFFRPESIVFDNNLVQNVNLSAKFLLHFFCMINTLFNVFDVLEEFLHFWDTHLFLHLLNKPLFQVYDSCVFVIFTKVDIFQQPWSNKFFVLFCKVNLFL